MSADDAAVNELVINFKNLVEDNNLKPDQLYSIDVTGLNYKTLPKRTLASKFENITGTNRQTIELQLFHVTIPAEVINCHVIGKSKIPRAFNLRF